MMIIQYPLSITEAATEGVLHTKPVLKQYFYTIFTGKHLRFFEVLFL